MHTTCLTCAPHPELEQSPRPSRAGHRVFSATVSTTTYMLLQRTKKLLSGSLLGKEPCPGLRWNTGALC